MVAAHVKATSAAAHVDHHGQSSFRELSMMAWTRRSTAGSAASLSPDRRFTRLPGASGSAVAGFRL